MVISVKQLVVIMSSWFCDWLKIFGVRLLSKVKVQISTRIIFRMSFYELFGNWFFYPFFFFFVENIFAYLLKNQKRLVGDVSERLFGNANPTHYARITFLVGIIAFFGLIDEYEYIALFSWHIFTWWVNCQWEYVVV